ncbi:hypothetical protein [Pontibacter rugosus]|uniref:Uncharacterized protein n=1 Tax=Pontibacter rugosus TaxID=1745966 RepID=A0ABW3SUQ4_9BACT
MMICLSDTATILEIATIAKQAKPVNFSYFLFNLVSELSILQNPLAPPAVSFGKTPAEKHNFTVATLFLVKDLEF